MWRAADVPSFVRSNFEFSQCPSCDVSSSFVVLILSRVRGVVDAASFYARLGR